MKHPASRTQAQWRILGRDGRFNVSTAGRRRLDLKDLYYHLVSTSWPKFFELVFGSYLLINIVFAVAYFCCGPSALEGIRRGSVFEHFMDSFFFSVQTVATIGYGRISPVGLIPNLLVTIEALTGLMMVGLMTGLLFTRFSRSTAKVVFSERAIIHKENGECSFSFRLGNERLNQISEAKLFVTLVKSEVNAEGENYRKMYDLKLDRNQSPLFMLSWTAVHTINASSPLYGMTDASLRETGTEILVSLSGTDNAFSQPIYARFSYTADDIVWNGRFTDMLERKDGDVRVHMDRIHEIKSGK